MTLLQPFHFQTPDRPKEADYSDPESFNEAVSEWEWLYGDKPEIEWNDDWEVSPGSTSYLFSVYKSEHDARLQEWQYHQVKFPGFKKKGHLTFENQFVDDKWNNVIFKETGAVLVATKNFTGRWSKGIPLKMFEDIINM